MRIKRYLSLFLVVLVSVFALGFANIEVKADEELILLYETGFEDLTANHAYADGVLTTNSKKWITNQVGYYKGDSNDKKVGDKSLRFRSNAETSVIASLSSDFTLTNVYQITFDYAWYSTHTEGRVYVAISKDNENWINIAEVIKPTDTLQTANIAIDYTKESIISEGIDFNTDIYIKIFVKNTSGDNKSTNIDNIKIYSKEFDTSITALVNQLFDLENQTLIPGISAEYGQDVNIPVELVSGYEFQFAVVNGVIRNDFVVGEDYTLPITEGLDVSLVYATEDTHAVLFLDSNGKLILNTWVDNGENVTAPVTTELLKPGYKLSETPWLSNEGVESLENITSSRVYRLQYELEETSKVNITVGETTTEYNFNDVVTLTATNPDFKAWVDENDNILSTSETFKFTALTNRTVNESTEVTLPTTPIITMTNDLGLREGMQTFLGQLELRDSDTLVEYGLVVTNDGFLRDEELTLDNGTKAKSNVLVPATNEFLLSIGENYLVVRAFVTVRNAEGLIETFYSNNQYDDVAIVTFDTDGGNEIDPVAIKAGTAVQKPADPERPLHEFLGWFVGETEFDFDTLINEDTIITAKWQENLPTIAEVRALDVDTATEFKGIVTGIDGNNLFVQDETAAIYLFGAKLPEGLKVGDEVRIQGTRDVYAGLQQIGSGATVTIESSGNALPTILEVTDITTLNADSQTKRITVAGLTVKSQSGNDLILTDGINDILVYASTRSAVYEHIRTAIVDQAVNIHQAFVGWFNGVQLTVLDVEDLEFVEPSDEELAQLVLDEIVAEWSNKEFNMGTSVELPLTGDFDSTAVWEFTKQGETETTSVVVDGKWIDVDVDTIYEVLVTLTLGEAELTREFNITILFVDENSQTYIPATWDWTIEESIGNSIKSNNSTTINGLLISWSWSGKYNTGMYLGYDGTKGQQIGSGKQPARGTITFEISLPENSIITGYSISASTASGGNTTLNHYGMNNKLTGNNTAYSNNEINVTSNTFTFSMTNVTSAMYLKNVTINYEYPN